MILHKKSPLPVLFVFFLLCISNALQGCPFCKKDSNKLKALSQNYYEFIMTEHPEFATLEGYQGNDNFWTDLSEERIECRNAKFKEMFSELEGISTEYLEDEEKVNYEVLKTLLRDHLENAPFKKEYLLMNQLDGIHLMVGIILNMMPTTTPLEVENLIERMERIPLLLSQTTDLLKKGVEQGIVMPKVSVQAIPDQIKSFTTENPAESYYFIPFTGLDDSFSQEEKEIYQNKAASILQSLVFPALKQLCDYLEEEYIPNCRDAIALAALPQGDQMYAHCVKSFTTTNLKPEQIYQIGLEEVTRINKEMALIKEELGFSGDLKDFFYFLSQNPSFFYSTEQDLLDGYRQILRTIEQNLPNLFDKLPNSPYVILPVPLIGEDQAPAAFYLEGSQKTNRPGVFFVNTGSLETRVKWEMEALALHEALPGHHMQISLALENDSLPPFSSITFFTAYIEGWGLYSEGLGKDLGLYRDPYSRFGKLNLEMLRAVRLVVDTGIHAFGWSREMAVDYARANTSLSLHEIENEIDRYITWPGQALAYKIGEKKILEMRQRAEKALGDSFNVKAFHNKVLSHGALPLDLFEVVMEKWINDSKENCLAN